MSDPTAYAPERNVYATRYTDPTAVGYLVRQLVRCGSAGCHCVQERGHEAFYLVSRVLEDGSWRQRKRYVRKADVPTLRRRLAEAKARDRAMTSLLKAGRVLRAAIQARSRGGLSDDGLEEVANGIDQS